MDPNHSIIKELHCNLCFDAVTSQSKLEEKDMCAPESSSVS